MMASRVALDLEIAHQIGDRCTVMVVHGVLLQNLDPTARLSKPTGILSATPCQGNPLGAPKPYSMLPADLAGAGTLETFAEEVVDEGEVGETIVETAEGIEIATSGIEEIIHTEMNVVENVIGEIGEIVSEIALGDDDHRLAVSTPSEPGADRGMDLCLLAHLHPILPLLLRIEVAIVVEVVEEVAATGETEVVDEGSMMIVTDMVRPTGPVPRKGDIETVTTVIAKFDIQMPICAHAIIETIAMFEIVKLDQNSSELLTNHLHYPLRTSRRRLWPQPHRLSDQYLTELQQPMALKDERPTPSSSALNADARLPPIGPSRPYIDITQSPIPSGPRSSTMNINRPGPSSKQWINPNIKRVPESPKLNRSQSLAQPRPAGPRPDGTHTDQPADNDQRPPSSDTKADALVDKQPKDTHTVEHEDPTKSDQRPQSARSSVDQERRPQDAVPNAIVKEEDSEGRRVDDTTQETRAAEPEALPVVTETKPKELRRPTLKVPPKHVSLPRKEIKLPISDQSSESDDEEIGDVIESQMKDVESKLKQLEGIGDVPLDAIVRHAVVSLEAVDRILHEPEGLDDMVGPVPENISIPGKTPEIEPQPEKEPSIEATKTPDDTKEANDSQKVIKNKTPSPSLEKEPSPLKTRSSSAERPQPSIEQDIDMPAPFEAPPDENKLQDDDRDVAMEDVQDISQPDSEAQAQRVHLPASQRQSIDGPFEPTHKQSHEISKEGSTIPSPAEDEDETDIEDVDFQTIEIVRENMPTPPIDSLPYFDGKPWFKDHDFLKSMDAQQPGLDAFILQKLDEEASVRNTVEKQGQELYDRNYDRYLRFTMSNDPVAVKSREKFTHIPGETNGHRPGFHESRPENTRRSRYASERDLERILEESRRVEDEKRERQMQAERERYRTEKEAVLPRQYQVPEEREQESYRDVTGFIQAEKIVAAWQLLPPVDNFTQDETATFEKAYLEFPKQWGRVSEPLAERDFGTSIQFYYLKKEKEELNLKEKLKKRPRQRKKGRGKQRSSALVSELGNGENENEENQETGENGERRRPRRAAAPTFNSEATPATDGESGTPSGTPGRRGAKGDGNTEKPERKPRGRRAAKDKEPKQPRVNQTLAAAPPTGTKGNRSRSSSRVHGPEWVPPQTPNEAARAPTQYELAPSTAAVPPVSISAPFPPAQPIPSPERGVPPPPPPPPAASMSVDTMGPPPLRPEPPQQPPVAMLDLSQPSASDRRSGTQASSYWSVPEANDFPQLLRSFGSDWGAIAAHMRTKTPIMIKNYYMRKKDGNGWEVIVEEADGRKARGEKRPAPPAPSSGVKKRYETSSNRPLAAADAVMEDSPAPKLDHPQASQPTSGRFNVPIAAQPQPTLIQAPFVPATQSPLIQSHGATPPGSQPLAQPVSRTMSPRPMGTPFALADRERELPTQQPVRVPLGQKPAPTGPPPVSEAPMTRHPLPGSLIEPHSERPRAEPKVPKEQPRQQLRVKQEPDLIHHQFERFVPQAQTARMTSRPESAPLSRPPDPPRAVAPAPQVVQPGSFATILQQSRSVMQEGNPSPPARARLTSTLSRPASGAGGGAEPFSAPPAQPTPPAVASAPARPPERKTSNLMALLNDDPAPPPPPPKRITEVPTAANTSSTPPPPPALSRPPPPPPASSHVRRESNLQESQPYGYSRNPPPAQSAMPPLKPPYAGAVASPQMQSLNAPRHMPMESPADREYYGGRPRSYTSTHQSQAAGSPQNAHHYPAPNQPSQVAYPPQPPSYPYGAQVQPSNVASPPPQYGGHSAPRGHEHSSSRDLGWPGPHQGHPLQQQHQPHQQHQQAQQAPPQHQSAWSSHPPQPPKSTQPPPPQSAWAQQQPTPKPPAPSSSVPPQPSWASAPPPQRSHDPMALRDVYPPHGAMRGPLQAQYGSAPRAPDPGPPQPPAAYPRYANTPGPGPGPGRDPRDPGPARSYTPSPYDNRGYPPNQEFRDPQMREQQPSMLQQQLRPQDPRYYEQRPPDRYGRQ
ncbi:hypothetical protein ABKA04_002655 [Annulohypoxylon sp. FPYF3050]